MNGNGIKVGTWNFVVNNVKTVGGIVATTIVATVGTVFWVQAEIKSSVTEEVAEHKESGVHPGAATEEQLLATQEQVKAIAVHLANFEARQAEQTHQLTEVIRELSTFMGELKGEIKARRSSP